MAVGEKSPTLLLGDLPKTMARIRRLVREHPHDRELQRLLHHLLTTMSSDRVDEAAVGAVLEQMEARCGALPPATGNGKARATYASSSPSPPKPSPPPQTPLGTSSSWVRDAQVLASGGFGAPSSSVAAGGASSSLTPPSGGGRSELARMREAGAQYLADGGASPPLRGGGGAERRAFELQLAEMRRQHEAELSALRQRLLRDTRQARAEHEAEAASLRRTCEQQLSTAVAAHRCELQRVTVRQQELSSELQREANLKEEVRTRAQFERNSGAIL